MATAKKTVKSDATNKKGDAAKKSSASKKSTKKKVDTTGVVDEFLDAVVGETFTEEPKKEDNAKKTTKKKKTEKETLDEFAQQSENGTLSLPKEDKKKKTTTKKKTTPKTKKTDEIKLIDAEAELNEILSQQITEENIRVADEIEKAISEQKELKKKGEKLGLAEDSQEPPQDIVTDPGLTDVSSTELPDKIERPLEVIEEETTDTFTEVDEKYYEQQPDKLLTEAEAESEDGVNNPSIVGNLNGGTISERYADKKVNQDYFTKFNTTHKNRVNSLTKKWDDDEKQETGNIKEKNENENNKPRNIVYPPIIEEEENEEDNNETNDNIETLKVKLEERKPETKFTFVTTSMGVRYD